MPKTSAGLLLYRWRGDELEVFLVHPGGPFWARRDAGAWSIPKGEIGPDEAPLAAARREFEEETGLAVEGDVIALSPIRQAGGKLVHAFAIEAEVDPGAIVSNRFSLEWPPRSASGATFPRSTAPAGSARGRTAEAPGGSAALARGPAPASAAVTDRRHRLWPAVAALLALALATAVVWSYALGAPMPLPGFELSVEAVEAEIRSFGMWGVAASILLMVLHSFVPFPAELVAMANGMLYGPGFGTLITWTGAMLGAHLAFGLARWLGRPFGAAVVAERHRAAIDRWAARQGAGVLLVSRCVPVISFNLINYAAGLTGVSWWTFSWTTGSRHPAADLPDGGGGRPPLVGPGRPLVWLVAAALLGWLLWWARVGRRRHAGDRP